ncbi:conserved hypothetical protein [Culex quinquefasciatus]|uniref:NAD(P)-binding domain-containing protein n=1 Tax=Culex quinquefasciatus TaxID=7176 RepID=B0WX84_CULQU|nr:flavin reductase (NADPH) [Culex quinquefasciatus]EDS36345.1 conserved hypothetical protein [Culex quinquefasciatus]|eukprot:XP_001862006.1 conserved hypothetical protein [Culex quinquefasciatus]
MTMSKIVIFGGTGMTGTCAVRYALEKGLKVRLMVRNEITVPEEFKNMVELVQGDVVNANEVENAVKDQELVCVVLGTRNDLKPTTVMSVGMMNIRKAMEKYNLLKVSVCLSSFLFFEPGKVPKMFTDLNIEHQRMLDILKASSLEFRAILPPHIADEPSGEFALAYDKPPNLSRTISKIDLGMFLIDSLFDDKHAKQVIGICTKP